MIPRLLPRFVVACAPILLALPALLRAEETTATAKFSQPDQPGTLKILVARGTLDIKGTDSPDVKVRSSLQTHPKAKRQDGLRVLTSTTSIALTEKDNVITLDATGAGGPAAGGNFVVEVPRSSSIIVQNSWGGDVKCRDVGGDVEINGMNGSIDLANLAGGVAVSTMNGEIRAEIREVREGKAMSFQSMNGEIILRVPESAHASFRIRTQNGSVLTDFEENILATRTENLRGSSETRGTGTSKGSTMFPPEAREAIREAARVGAEAVREAAVAIREAAEAAREGAESSRASGGSSSAPKPPAAPRAPRPPKVMSMPTITGGKLVTGALNGGGPEISIATMNGDVVVRRAGK